MDVIFNIMQVDMSCVTFVSTLHNSFIKHVKWVGLGWVRSTRLINRSG